MDFEREMIEKDGFVSFEQKPVFDFADHIFLPFRLFILLGDGFVDILLLGLVGIAGLYHRDLLFIVVGEFDLLDDFFVLEVDCVHFG